jgi:hypothetical protein
MHMTEHFFRESAERLFKAQRNVESARQFNSSMQPRATAAAANESFGEKLKRAVSKRKEQAQQQPRRSSRKPQRRERSKGE